MSDAHWVLERPRYDAPPTGTRLRPLRDKILVKVMTKELSDSVIANWAGKPVLGIVVAAGPGRYPNIHTRGFRPGVNGEPVPFHEIRISKVFRPTEVKVGQVVEFGGMEIGGYALNQVFIDGELHILTSEQDVVAVHE